MVQCDAYTHGAACSLVQKKWVWQLWAPAVAKTSKAQQASIVCVVGSARVSAVGSANVCISNKDQMLMCSALWSICHTSKQTGDAAASQHVTPKSSTHGTNNAVADREFVCGKHVSILSTLNRNGCVEQGVQKPNRLVQPNRRTSARRAVPTAAVWCGRPSVV